MSKDTLEKHGEKAKNYMGHFGQAKFIAHKSHENGYDYGGIELVIDQGLAKDLQEHINKGLNIQNGIPLTMEFLEWGARKESNFIYMARVIPTTKLNHEQYKIALRDYMHRLPKVLHDFAQKNCRLQAKEAKRKTNTSE